MYTQHRATLLDIQDQSISCIIIDIQYAICPTPVQKFGHTQIPYPSFKRVNFQETYGGLFVSSVLHSRQCTAGEYNTEYTYCTYDDRRTR
jgi:hypothetical protein